jgi:uncharacterized protein RhaS with RHS repeats
MYDYGARNYDPALGRWMNIDPLAEKYLNLTLYNYVANNPIVNIDPNGKDIIFITGKGIMSEILDITKVIFMMFKQEKDIIQEKKV